MESRFYTAQNFEPKFFTGGPTRFYLPLFYDIVAQEKPALIVILGLGDAQAHLAFCQAIAEQNLPSRCVTVRRARADETIANDSAYQFADKVAAEFFPTISQLIEDDPKLVATQFAEGSINLLLIDDVDSANTLRCELELWSPKLSGDALVLLHGLDLERADSPRTAWLIYVRQKTAAEFHAGIGLGIATNRAAMKSSLLREAIFLNTAALTESYEIIADLMHARAQTKRAEHRACMLEARQIWFDAVFEDRSKAQDAMEHQQRVIAYLESQLAALREDRAKAQLVIDSQLEQLQGFAAVLEQSQAQLDRANKKIADLKSLINTAKAVCRKKGRCFDIRKEPKPKRSMPERVVREFARTKRNLRRMLLPPRLKRTR